MRLISMVSIVASVSLLAGACAPRAKPVGYVGGTFLAAVGAGMVASAGDRGGSDRTGDPISDGIGSVASSVGDIVLGSAMVLAGLGILAGTALSPSEPDAPGPANVEPLPPPPATPWPAPPPSRSSSAPSGSPLALAAPPALSMRAGSPLPFD